MASSRGLGKGIESLLPSKVDVQKLMGGADIKNIDVHQVVPNPDQPRRTISETQLDELAQSIKEHGVLQPILVVKKDDTKYMIVAGERRWRASEKAGQKTIPAIIRTMGDLQLLQVALIENVQREDLNPIEQAESIRRLHDDFNQKYEDIAKSLGKAYASVANTVRLLKLPTRMQESLIDKKISEGHARAILALVDFPGKQEELHNNIIQDGWSVRRSEQFVKESKLAKDDVATKKRSSKYIENNWTKNLSSSLDTDVLINPMAKGGFIKITYKDDGELERIQKQLS